MRVVTLVVFAGLVFLSTAQAQSERRIIDVHAHFGLDAERNEVHAQSLSDNGISKVVAILPNSDLVLPSQSDHPSFIRALGFPCPLGRVPNGGPPCFDTGEDFPDLELLRAAVESGQVQVFGEIYSQYYGIRADDESLEPFWQLAEEYDIPVGVHLSVAPPSTAYGCCPGFRTEFGNPQVLENVLVRYPKLRVYIMHAGWPYMEEVIALMLAYPQLYLDISGINNGLPRSEFDRYLERLVSLGFSIRIMWGSDGNVERGIEAVEGADYLTDGQKDNIFYNNAVRFFRLYETEE